MQKEAMQTVLGVIANYIGSEDVSELVKQLFEVGAHYGHPTRAWNPLMAGFIYGTEGKSHVIDMRLTVRYLLKALEFLYLSAKNNSKILFVCTDPQISEMVGQEANRCMQYYVSKRWTAGLLTNWNTVKQSIDNMHKMEKTLAEYGECMKKKERLMLQRKIDKNRSSLGGIEHMGELPDVMVISSLVDEAIAVEEVRRLQKLGVQIKSIGFADTNSNPHLVDYPIPCNDDSIRVLEFMFKLFGNIILEGLVDGENATDVKMVTHMADQVQDELKAE